MAFKLIWSLVGPARYGDQKSIEGEWQKSSKENRPDPLRRQ